MKRKTSIAIGFLLAAITTYGQLAQPFRFEQEVKESEEGFVVIPMKTEGLALVNGTNTYEHGKRTWTVEILDTTLTSRWQTGVQLENTQNFIGYEYTPGHLFLLFRSGEYQGHSFRLVQMNLHTKETRINTVEFELNFRIAYFTVCGDNAVFGGYINSEPAVLLFDQSSEHPKVLPGLFVKDVELLDVRANQNETFNILLVERRTKEKDILTLRTYDHTGQLLLDESMEVDAKYSVLSAITSSLEREELLVAGTYAEGTSKQALGIFTVQIDPFNDERIQYVDFASLEHFLDYLKPKKASKIRTKANQQKAAGLPPDYRLYAKPMRLEERADGYYLLTESYNPSGGGSSYWPGSYYSPYYGNYGAYPSYSPFRRYNSYYDPFPYTTSRSYDFKMIQSAVIKLSPTGKPVKDLSIKLDEVRQSGLEQISDFFVHRDSLYLAFKKEGKIYYVKEHSEGEEDSVTRELVVRSRDASEKTDEEDEGYLRYWYGENFYVWGYQYIKVYKSEGVEKRNVFYVNRISPGH
ncbi:MAG: hypothetical protein JST14_00565 [Bacteroidetes bacterium]|nr:hypothetical protein [Bacteroidota bacterium]